MYIIYICTIYEVPFTLEVIYADLGPDSRKVSSLKSEILVSNLRFFSDLRPFAHLGFTKDLRLIIFSDLVSNLRLPRG